MVQAKIIQYDDSTMRVSMPERLNLTRIDYLRQAEEPVPFAQSTDIKLRKKHIGKELVNILNARLRRREACTETIGSARAVGNLGA